MSVTLANGGAVDRSTTDFYPTPYEATEALLKFLSLPRETTIWEPAAGEGHMSLVMRRWGYSVSESDLFSYTFENFLDITELRGDWIITNPPFKYAEQFIRHALSFKPKGVAMLLKSQYWHAAKRLALFNEHPPTHVLPLTWRPDFLFGKKGSAPTMDVHWTVWHSDSSMTTRYQPLERPSASHTT